MSNIQKSLNELYQRDLNRLSDEVEAISEDLLWERKPGIINSCGVLTQHLIGNFRHYIGTGLGRTGYKRDRAREFINTGLAKNTLLQQLEELKNEIDTVLSSLNEDDLQSAYPRKFPFNATINEALIHLYGHLNYHLGQVNYLRRMIEEKS